MGRESSLTSWRVLGVASLVVLTFFAVFLIVAENNALAKENKGLDGIDGRPVKNVAFVVPYRNRAKHLEIFREHMRRHAGLWNANASPRQKWTFYYVEQLDSQLFNRGWLLNIGMRAALADSQTWDCIITHDVDSFPTPNVDYTFCEWPTQLSSEHECSAWSIKNHAGGVMALSPAHWTAVNGYSNNFWGWGCEDDELAMRLGHADLLKAFSDFEYLDERGKVWHTAFLEKDLLKVSETGKAHRSVVRPPAGQGRFECLRDKDHTPRLSLPGWTWLKQHAKVDVSERLRRWTTDGINTTHYYEVDARQILKDPHPSHHLFEETWLHVAAEPIIVCTPKAGSTPEIVIDRTWNQNGYAPVCCQVCDEVQFPWCRGGGYVPRDLATKTPHPAALPGCLALDWLLGMTKDQRGEVYTIEEQAFNKAFQTSSHHIIWWNCPSCDLLKINMYYKRITDVKTFEPFFYMSCKWTATNNILGEDFQLYSSLEDALQDRNPFRYCNYTSGAEGIGFPFDCGAPDIAFEEGNFASIPVPGCGTSEYFGRASSFYIYLL